MSDSSPKVPDDGCLTDPSGPLCEEAGEQNSTANSEIQKPHADSTRLCPTMHDHEDSSSTKEKSDGGDASITADAELLSEFQSGLEKTLSLVAHMSEAMKLKAMESLKVILPDHSPNTKPETNHQVAAMGDTENEPTVMVESPFKVYGSAKRKITTRGGMPKKLTTSLRIDPPLIAATNDKPKMHSVCMEQESSVPKPAKKRGRPRKTSFAHESVSNSSSVQSNEQNCSVIEYVKPKRRRGPPRRYLLVDGDDEIALPSAAKIKKEKTDVTCDERDSVSSSPEESQGKSKFKEEVSSDFEYVDNEEDCDWTNDGKGDKKLTGSSHHGKTYANKKLGTKYEQISNKKACYVKTGDGMWKCSVCGKRSNNKQNIVVHLRIHTGERPYQCEVCGRSFSILTNMQRHVRERHGHKPNLACPAEGCTHVFWVSKTLSEHMNKSHPGMKNPWKKTVECPECQKVFKSQALLKVHCAVHRKEKAFTCAVCKRAFSFKTNLLRHAWTHKDTNLYPHTCTICDKKYIEKKSLDAHLLRDHHGMKERSEADRKFECEICNKKFFTKGNYNHHQIIHGGFKPHPCPICGKSFTMKSNMHRHTRTHSGEKPWMCTTCGKGFTEKKSLKVHQRQHTGERPYKCEICGKAYSQLGTLHSHMPVHNKERNYLCLYCGKSFLRKSHFNFHMKKHNTGPTLSCTECDMMFYRNGDLQRHLITHTSEKPYTCTLCPKRFTRMQYLKEHVNQHTGARPHKCKLCDMAFADSSSMYKHQRVHNARNQEAASKTQKKEQLVTDSSIVAPLSQIVDHIVDSNPGGAGPCEETIFTDFGTTGSERTYICKLCQEALPDLENCYEHQKVHGNAEVSFVVTLKQPEECDIGGRAVPHYQQTDCAMDIQQESGLNSPIMQHNIISTPTAISDNNQISIESVMEVSNVSSPSTGIVQEQMSQPMESVTHIDDQMINTVSMTTGGMTTKYYVTDAGQSLTPVAMVMEEVQDINVIPQQVVTQESQQPYLILLKNQT